MTHQPGVYVPLRALFLVCSNDDPGVTLTYFSARSNLVT